MYLIYIFQRLDIPYSFNIFSTRYSHQIVDFVSSRVCDGITITNAHSVLTRRCRPHGDGILIGGAAADLLTVLGTNWPMALRDFSDNSPYHSGDRMRMCWRSSVGKIHTLTFIIRINASTFYRETIIKHILDMLSNRRWSHVCNRRILFNYQL